MILRTKTIWYSKACVRLTIHRQVFWRTSNIPDPHFSVYYYCINLWADRSLIYNVWSDLHDLYHVCPWWNLYDARLSRAHMLRLPSGEWNMYAIFTKCGSCCVTSHNGKINIRSGMTQITIAHLRRAYTHHNRLPSLQRAPYCVFVQ